MVLSPIVALVSSQPYSAPAAIEGTASLLVHTMPSLHGEQTQASALLFVPPGTPPAGGWPVVVWIHGTTSVGHRLAAPSLSPDLDGGLTDDGFPSGYAELIATLVAAGYAVVAPDLEGLGEAASVPYPYYNAASTARSVTAGLQAAHQTHTPLSTHWAVVGHSDGGRGALSVEPYVSHVPGLGLRGVVAYAPFTSMRESVTALGTLARHDPANAANYVAVQNNLVLMMALALRAQRPDADLEPLLGRDLEAMIPAYQSQGIFKSVIGMMQHVGTVKPENFAGFHPEWHNDPDMQTFLTANDPAEMPDLVLNIPTLIVQGAMDEFVLEPLTTALATRLKDAGSAVTYQVYPEATHGSIVQAATPDVLKFLNSRLR